MNNTSEQRGSPLMVILAFATVYIVWGSTFFFIQKAISGFPPLMLGALRFLVAGLLLLSWTYFRGEKVFDRQNIRYALITGLLLLFVGNGVVIWVEQFLPSAMVAIMVSSTPLWFVLLDKPKWAENFRSRYTIVGLIIGFVGIFLLFGEKIVEAFSAVGSAREIGGLFLLLAGSISWAGGSLYSKYKLNGNSATVNTSWQMLSAGLAFTIGSLFRGEHVALDWNTIPNEAWLSLLYLIFFGSIAGYSAYVWLLQVRPATQVSTYAYVNPVVAVLLGVFFAGETISLFQLFGLAVILASVLIINLSKLKHSTTAEIPLEKEDSLQSDIRLLKISPRATTLKK